MSGLTLTAYSYVNADGEREVLEEDVAVTADMVSGFDTSAVSDSVTVTVTYEGVTATYDIEVYESNVTSTCASIGSTPAGLIFGAVALMGMAAVLLLFRKKKSA